MKKLLLVVCLAVPVLAFGQQGQTGLNGVSFIAPLQISGGTDHNFLVDRTNPNQRLLVLSLPPSLQSAAPSILPKRLDDQVFTVVLPKIGYQNDSKRHEFFATYVPEFEMFAHNSDQNAMGQEATATFTYFLARNIQISAGDSYRSSHDPARTLDNVMLLLPRSPYHENDIRAGLEFVVNPLTAFGARYDNDRANFGQTDPFQARILDSQSAGYSVFGTRMLSRTQRLRVTYGIFKITPLNPHAKFEDQVDVPYSFTKPIHSGTLEYRLALNPNTILTFSGGAIGLDTGLNYTFRAGIDKRIGNYYWLSGGFARSLSFSSGTTPAGFSPGLGSTGFFDVYTARFKGQPTRKIGVLFDTTISRDAAGKVATGIQSLMARARLDYRVSDREVLFTSIESFEQNNNAYVRAPLSRNRFMVGIEISLSNETDRRLNHANQDAQYVALTDHQRRRSTAQ
jgi:hypothetical protein